MKRKIFVIMTGFLLFFMLGCNEITQTETTMSTSETTTVDNTTNTTTINNTTVATTTQNTTTEITTNTTTQNTTIQTTIDLNDEYQSLLELFIFGLNSVSLTDEEVCGTYLEPGYGYEECVLKRAQVINGQETVSIDHFEWLDAENFSFKVGIEFEGEDGPYVEEVEGDFYLDTQENIRIYLMIPYGISRLERTAILMQLVNDSNDFEIETYEITDDVLDNESVSLFTPIREYMLDNEMTIVDYDIIFGSTTFSFELENGDRYVYDVTWEYSINHWVMHWERIYYEGEISELDQMLLLERFVLGFNTSSATNDYFCAMYVSDDSTMDCISLRTELWGVSQYLELGLVNYDLTVIPVQFLVLDSSMTSIDFYINYDLQYVVIDNDLFLKFTNELRYVPLDLVDAEMVIDGFIANINDFIMLSDTDFCDIYGYLFIDCMEFRSRISADFWMAMEEDFIEEEDGYTLLLGLYDSMMRLAEVITFDLDVGEDMEENPIIMGSIIDDVLIPPDEGYDLIFAEFMEDYFDEMMTDQDIFDTYNDGWEFEGLYHRDIILEEDLEYAIGDITWHADMGFTWYEATVVFTYPDDSFFIATIKYVLFPGIGEDYLFQLIYDIDMPSEYTVGLRVDSYVNDLNNIAISNEDFCINYAVSWDYEGCLEFRQQYLDGSYDADVLSVNREDYYAEFLVEFTNDDINYTNLLMELYTECDLTGYPWLLAEIKHPDTELRDALSNYIVDGIIYGFNTHGINITTFCNEFAECGTAFDDIVSTVHHLTYVEVAWNLTDYFDPELLVKIQFTYYDSVVETHGYYATFVIEGEYRVWTLHFIRKVPLE